jgi:hypothetical protein
MFKLSSIFGLNLFNSTTIEPRRFECCRGDGDLDRATVGSGPTTGGGRLSAVQGRGSPSSALCTGGTGAEAAVALQLGGE